MNGIQAVEYYHSLGKFGVMPGLERISVLCEKLGNPQNDFKAIHVAGTNGKGSTCTEIASVLTAAGYKTGLYTSPYVIDFRERIRFCGEMISEDELAFVTERVSKEIEILNNEGIKITEFEAVTAAAFLYYSLKKCDIAVLEVGLGGRFDATNIINPPLCSVITSISLDHVQILGNTLSEIAYEKSGIIKDGSVTVYSVTQSDEVKNVIEKTSLKKNCSVIRSDPDLFSVINEDIFGTDVDYDGLNFHIPFCGSHQLDNAALALNTVLYLRKAGYDISDNAIVSGFESAKIPARTEIINKTPLIMLDGSHNDGSTKALADTIKSYLSGKRIIAVCGMMADKDCKRSLANIVPLFSEVVAVKPSNPRSMNAEEFSLLVREFGVHCLVSDDPVQGIRLALSELKKFDCMIVCGSLYLAADVRKELLRLTKFL